VGRPEGWLIQVRQDGKCDVFLDRRPVVYDRDDVDEAVTFIRRYRDWAGQPIVVEDPDGYQQPMEVRSR
jgi:hypothetical protein